MANLAHCVVGSVNGVANKKYSSGKTKKSSGLRSVLQLYYCPLLSNYTGVRSIYYGETVPFLKMYEENSPTVEYLLPVCSKRNVIFLRTIFLTMELILKCQAVNTLCKLQIQLKV